MTEELRMTMRDLESLYLARKGSGWSLRIYDYTANQWREGEEAFSVPGTYELAVLVDPGGSPTRVRVLPPGSGGLWVEPSSAGRVGLWRSLGIDLAARHLRLITSLLEGREGTVALSELEMLLATEGSDVAREALRALAPLLEGEAP